MSTATAFSKAHAFPRKPTSDDYIRLAVEFEYQLWYPEHEDLFPRPAGRVYWVVRLGRLALCRNGAWAFYFTLGSSRNKQAVDYARQMRFESFDEAMKVATDFFKREPEHGTYMRETARMFEKQKD